MEYITNRLGQRIGELHGALETEQGRADALEDRMTAATARADAAEADAREMYGLLEEFETTHIHEANATGYELVAVKWSGLRAVLEGAFYDDRAREEEKQGGA